MPKENIYNTLYERARNGERFTGYNPLLFYEQELIFRSLPKS